MCVCVCVCVCVHSCGHAFACMHTCVCESVIKGFINFPRNSFVMSKQIYVYIVTDQESLTCIKNADQKNKKQPKKQNQCFLFCFV